ncbi:hypothetical protein [Scytonema sp. NUACC26]|uniref:hypothetical protein n=1 Tax=Scytonema sp. NUACC26 TaxID=3140176 RepID=UPI0034DBE2E0
MFQTSQEIDEQIHHLRNLLRQQTQNLRMIETHMASFAFNMIPIHLLNQQEFIETERTKILKKIQELEQHRGNDSDRQIEVDIQSLYKFLPTGILHLYSQEDLPIVKFYIVNPTNTAKTVVLSSGIEQFSYIRSDTVQIAPAQSKSLTQLPILKQDEIASLYEVRRAILHTRVSCIENGQESLLSLQDYDVQFLARDVITWAIVDDENTVRDLSYHIAAWVTPNDRAVVEMLRYAADYSPTGVLRGYQGGGNVEEKASRVRSQVEAIFQALKLKAEITYISASISFGKQADEVQQRVNLPKDSLLNRQANCIDGAVLYASLLERAAMNPAIVLTRGHAFVGWEISPGSKQYEFLETTMTRNHSFEEAFKRGMEQFKRVSSLLERPFFDSQGFARLIDIKEIRSRGIFPME